MAFSSLGWKAACPQAAGQARSSAPNTLKGRPDFGEQKAKKQEENEVWLIDFGLAGKIRPALVVSVAFCDRDRALITVVHTRPVCAALPLGSPHCKHKSAGL